MRNRRCSVRSELAAGNECPAWKGDTANATTIFVPPPSAPHAFLARVFVAEAPSRDHGSPRYAAHLPLTSPASSHDPHPQPLPTRGRGAHRVCGPPEPNIAIT